MSNENKKEKRIIYILLAIILVGAWWFFDNNSSADDVAQSDTGSAKEVKSEINFPEGTDDEVKTVITKVSKHILFPDKNLRVSTVTDAEEFKKQDPIRLQFVENGHRLIQTSHGIIIYNEEMDKIVDIVRVYPEIQANEGQQDAGEQTQ
tara:strand:- start:204 stop:650 length:447 start_codon:yes stop_codon:yes gene_type:complete